MRPSIRKQILAWLIPLLFGLWVGSAFVSYLLITGFQREVFDRELTNSADSVVGRIRLNEGRVSVDLPPAAKEILQNDEMDSFYYRVFDQSGNPVSGDAELPYIAADLEIDKPKLDYLEIDGHRLRVAQIKVLVEGSENLSLVIQVAETTNSRTKLRQKIMLAIAGLQLLVIVIGLLSVWFGVSKGLAPMNTLQKLIKSRSPSDLSPVPDDNIPEEAYPLVLSINQLLGRVKDNLETNQRFIANAAHQLRTPLAGLKTYSSVGAEMSEIGDLKHVVAALDVGLDRASRMVGQLLALARTESAATDVVDPVDRVDLCLVVKETLEDLYQLASQKKIELTLEPLPDGAFLRGDQTRLRLLVSNLVENAIAYTREAGSVDIRVAQDEREVCFSVQDTGPGIAPVEREKVFERFYRVEGSGGTGSGLGLSIVAEIVRAYGASISLADVEGQDGESGTQVTVRFFRAD
ncbi:MAG: sensor histidine kinase N-terminal domain-containing protein [Candidatus Obscuribacterales bacterium]|nr:sensor histidine kinase N-terminal domain-containing protein [Candidatus Obscuribacterales bacterium]